MGNFISAAVRHLGLTYKILAILLTSIIIVAIFPHTPYGAHYDYKIGGIWRNSDLLAPYDFVVTKSEDTIRIEEETERRNATLYYKIDGQARTRAINKLESGRWDLTHDQIAQMRKVLDSIYQRGYIETDEYASAERLVAVKSNAADSSFYKHTMKDYITRDSLEPGLLRDSILEPNLIFDQVWTQNELSSRLSQLRYSSKQVKAGDLIIQFGILLLLIYGTSPHLKPKTTADSRMDTASGAKWLARCCWRSSPSWHSTCSSKTPATASSRTTARSPSSSSSSS